MKHERLYKFLGWFETITMYIILLICFIGYISEPTSGIWDFKFVMSKIICLVVILIISKIEGE